MLVDEFQDTDPVQWEILRRAFGDGGSTLVLIGDPKQAIYAFRGADVYAYLDAAASARRRAATLDVNWRSDQALLDAYDALFGGAALGHPRHRRTAASAPPRARAPRRPARRRRAIRVGRTATSRASPADARRLRPVGARARRPRPRRRRRRCCRDAELAPAPDGDASPSGPATSPCSCAPTAAPRWSATRSTDAGVPAVINGAGSVFAHRRRRASGCVLLEALERPRHARPRARRGADLLLRLDAPSASPAPARTTWEEVHRPPARLGARAARARASAALLETITLGEGLPERVLAAADGERRLTDLRHVGQLLHAAAATEQLGTDRADRAGCGARIAEADRDVDDEERSRRLESDAEAVQVLTIHRSKGLEFPVVYVPFLWEPAGIARQPATGARSTTPRPATRARLDVGARGHRRTRAHRGQQLVEERGEDLRLPTSR